jgi:hypothetical protein
MLIRIATADERTRLPPEPPKTASPYPSAPGLLPIIPRHFFLDRAGNAGGGDLRAIVCYRRLLKDHKNVMREECPDFKLDGVFGTSAQLPSNLTSCMRPLVI